MMILEKNREKHLNIVGKYKSGPVGPDYIIVIYNILLFN